LNAASGYQPRTVDLSSYACRTFALSFSGSEDGSFATSFALDDISLTSAGTSTVPATPTDVTATAGNARAVVSWSAPPANGGCPITRYTVTATPGGRTVTTTGARTATFGGLNNGTAYRFTVAATNAAGTSPVSVISAAVTPRPVVPGAPTGVLAAAANAAAAVSWTPPADNGGSAITGYAVRVVNAATSAQVGALRPAAAGTKGLAVTGLVNGTAYRLQVRASNAVGSSTPSALSNPVTAAATAAVTRLSDFNRDGISDLVARDSGGVLWLYPGNGAGSHSPRSRMAGGWAGMTALVTPGDVTGDRNSDILARDKAGTLWLYPGNGASGLGARRRISSGWKGYTITNAANLNRTGRPDLLARDANGVLWLYPFHGNAVLGRRAKISGGWKGYTTILGPGDVSGDGRADILARDAAGALWLYRGNGAGRLAARTRVSTGWQVRTALVTPGNWNRAVGNDLLMRDRSGALWFAPGDSHGHFGPAMPISTGWNGMTYIG
ncbi:MAG: hypothetical protein QOF35_1024, partial [Actinomycetota bacterium]|nr:hypothetical protein [Actinomycetota bacterium]